MMASWTPQYSTVLSRLLDKIVGTQEEIDTRQDYCKIVDSIALTFTQIKEYYTGSKAEGLRLPGSDDDLMREINTEYNINVVQSLDENTSTSPNCTFLMSTENVRPGFTLLRHVPQTPLHPFLIRSSQNMNGLRYLSSDLFIQNRLIEVQSFYRVPIMDGFLSIRRQGPSKEISAGCYDMEPGDTVDCIRCSFWPIEASEWRDRPRHFGWPKQHDLLYITDFGFHLVAVGHPHSDTSGTEWRISFSIAERTLVWSFNHVQIQCYALMKIILKQFIKVRCSPQNQVLCSYFIKTFLFWKYETTDVDFWREDNLRECINYLLVEFSKCIRDGVLRHYFIHRFNLLSVKLTPAAQRELLQLFDIIIESDISILKDCECLQECWSMGLQTIDCGNEMIEFVIRYGNKLYNFANDKKMIILFESLRDTIGQVLCWFPPCGNTFFCNILSLFCKTPLQKSVLTQILLNTHINSATESSSSRNKCVYRLKQIAQSEMCTFDISTCKLWCAILLYIAGDYQSTLDIINQVLSSIPPYAMQSHVNNEAEQMYRDVFGSSNLTIIQKAKKAWMFQMFFVKGTPYPLPLAIKIELYFRYISLELSPFTCTYYLQFLCYYDLQQYENRDSALEQLVDFVTHAAVKDRNPYSDLNIAGHCLLLVGKVVEARDMFNLSYAITERLSSFDHARNSATWYLLSCF